VGPRVVVQENETFSEQPAPFVLDRVTTEHALRRYDKGLFFNNKSDVDFGIAYVTGNYVV
jgi:hypothetical protein